MNSLVGGRPGVEVVVKGYKAGDAVYAMSVSLPSEEKALQLRDEEGLPRWDGTLAGMPAAS